MTKYKTVFINWSGTLSNSKFWEQLADPLHPRSSWFQKLEYSLFNNLKDKIRPWMRGKYTSEQICKMVAEDTGFNYETILQDFIIGCQKMRLSSPRLLEVVEKIRHKGSECIIATDNMDSFRRWTIPALNLEKYFDDFLISWELKCLKGDLENGQSKFFANYFKHQSLAFEDCVLLDDDLDESGIYARLGIDYVQISSPSDLVKKLEEISLMEDSPRASVRAIITPNADFSDEK